MEPGTKVRIAADVGPLGLLRSPNDLRFTDETTASGDECEVVETPANMPPDWLMVLHLRTNQFCPVHPGMIEAA